MRRGRILIILAVILIIGLILVLVALPRIIPTAINGAPTPANNVEVYYAKQSIPQGEPITDERLGTRTLPRDFLTEDMFTVEEASSLIGKIAKYPLDQGAFITTSMVANSDTELETPPPQWAVRIPVGKNAIAIPISRLASVAYGVQDGAHVNVIACMLLADVDPSYQTLLPNHVGIITSPLNVSPEQMPGISLGLTPAASDPPYQGRTEVEPAFQQGIYVLPSEPQRPRMVCQMVLQDVTVLKLGNFPLSIQSQPVDPNQPTPAQQTANSAALAPDIISLIVDPQDAVTLTYMIYSNIPLNLTLRRGGDDSRQATEAATLQFLLSQYNIPVPVKLAYGLTPRIDLLALPFLPNDVVTVPPQ
jgi:pilus assembly protein CpaB